MDFSYFISKRIRNAGKNSLTSIIHRIAIASVGLGLAVMLISFMIMGGYKAVIIDKIVSFAGHLQITKFTMSESFEEDPIDMNKTFLKDVSTLNFITHKHVFAHKTGLLKTNDEVEGIVIKGVGPDFDVDMFQENMVEGKFVTFGEEGGSKELVISKKISQKLQLKVGDEALVYFIQQPPRVRKLSVCGIYETGMEDFDDRLVLGDINMIRRLNNWSDSQIGGYEIFLDDMEDEDMAQDELYNVVNYDTYVEKVHDKYREIFDWLSLINKNVVIFLSLTLFMACVNMISILLILIMERTQMIGMLKALGATNTQIRTIFAYNGLSLILRGMILGNVIGIGFGLIQHFFKPIKLDQATYYMDTVPIDWNIQVIVLLNLLTFAVVGAVLTVPTVIVTRIRPIKTIKFD